MEKGRPSERILLTVKTFKRFCMKAETKKANEIHDYYIILEELLQETLNEESDELRNQLEEKSELESKHEKISKYIVRKHEKKNKSGNCLFKDKFKVGMTKNIDERLKDLNTSSPYQFKIMEIYYTSFNVTLEKLIKEVFSTERISVNCEWYKLSARKK